MPQRGDVISLRPLQKLRQRNTARTGRRHGDNLMPAIGKVHRRTPYRRIGRQILMGDEAAAAGHFIDQRIGDPALVKSGAALRANGRQCARQSGEFYPLAFAPFAIRLQHRRGEAVLLGKVFLKAVELARRFFGQNKAVLRQRHGGAQQHIPRLAAEFFVQRGHARHSARHTDREMTFQAEALNHLALFIEIHIAAGGKRRALAKIQRADIAIGEAVNHKAAAANITGLLIHHGEREIDRHRRVKRIAAARQHIAANLAGQPVRRHHHRLFAIHAFGRKTPMMARMQILNMQKRRGKHQRHQSENGQHGLFGRLIHERRPQNATGRLTARRIRASIALAAPAHSP